MSLKEEIVTLRQEVDSKNKSILEKLNAANATQIPAQSPIQTDSQAQNTAVPQEMRGFQSSNYQPSTGNEGVPTVISTGRQTHQQTDNSKDFTVSSVVQSPVKLHETLSNLDSLKRELRLKFKRLTNQEMLIFSTLYSLESQGFEEITYKVIANNINLSESSIRDYVSKLITKGIPIIKTRLNNKQVALNISPDLQKLASLSTITRLREL
jgi:predicted transcriptional regulator